MDAGVIAGAQRAQQYIILPCAVQHQIRVLLYSREIPLPVGAVNHSGLTETAAADAPALQLHRHTVLGHCNKRDQRLSRVRRLPPVIKICHHLSADTGRGSLLFIKERRADTILFRHKGRNSPVRLVSHLIQRRHIDTRYL